MICIKSLTEVFFIQMMLGEIEVYEFAEIPFILEANLKQLLIENLNSPKVISMVASGIKLSQLSPAVY